MIVGEGIVVIIKFHQALSLLFVHRMYKTICFLWFPPQISVCVHIPKLRGRKMLHYATF